MKITIAIAAAAIFTATMTNAQELPESADASERVKSVVTNPFEVTFNQICEYGAQSRVILTENATEACNANAMPNVIADGSRWSNRGVGSEFNTIARNLDVLTNQDA